MPFFVLKQKTKNQRDLKIVDDKKDFRFSVQLDDAYKNSDVLFYDVHYKLYLSSINFKWH